MKWGNIILAYVSPISISSASVAYLVLSTFWDNFLIY